MANGEWKALAEAPYAALPYSLLAIRHSPVLPMANVTLRNVRKTYIGGFEAIHALHVGAERIGRYLQVYYEDAPDAPRWETTAMAVGPALPGGGIDPRQRRARPASLDPGQ